MTATQTASPVQEPVTIAESIRRFDQAEKAKHYNRYIALISRSGAGDGAPELGAKEIAELHQIMRDLRISPDLLREHEEALQQARGLMVPIKAGSHIQQKIWDAEAAQRESSARTVEAVNKLEADHAKIAIVADELRHKRMGASDASIHLRGLKERFPDLLAGFDATVYD